MAFDSLSEKLNHVFSKMREKGKLTDLEIKQAMREIRIALLEADVNFQVVRDFINRVSEKASGEDILKGLNSTQQVIKIVNDELIALMGSTHSKLAVADRPPTIIMMCGLQGAGKTTMCGKLAGMLKKQNKKVMLAACDVYRPAAIKQLQVVGGKVNVPVFEEGQINPVKIAKDALDEAKRQGADVLIIDTAGRLHIDEQLMEELQKIKAEVKPNEILLVVDSMTGQDAVNVAETFNQKLDITGVIITKLDGDTRGGAALSIKAVTGKPIKFVGSGEKMEDIEPFYPDRMASRILGMGDVLTLIEKAQEAFSEEEALKLQKKMKTNSFTLQDYLNQLESVKKMGGIGKLMSMVPGLGGKINEDDIDESKIIKTKAIILSMTPEERNNPDIIKASRRKRIAAGSGTSIQDVNQLLKQFDMSKEMMRRVSKNGMRGMKFPF
ncbi:MAG: signal recognition particle protein [Eubacteriales bacterium]|nr:signal recognition particle protein [Clostridiales bacterium]MDY5529491.1 signal recognition particle protein [Eubacteriales bacterium]MDY6135648.1 signal recognition particle protein [Eubacteriales bacterium]